MEILSIVLELVIAVEILGVVFFVFRKQRQQPRSQKLASTEQMVKKILLNNKWDNIDDVIGILQQDSVHISYKLR